MLSPGRVTELQTHVAGMRWQADVLCKMSISLLQPQSIHLYYELQHQKAIHDMLQRSCKEGTIAGVPSYPGNLR
jgi:hypothetical protein